MLAHRLSLLMGSMVCKTSCPVCLQAVPRISINCDDGAEQQVMYLIDEAGNPGKPY